jgi:DNA-binding PadR family transcriptional regulator
MTDTALTITSYAILGQLALRPWSMYEMVKNIGRTLHWFWPRAESQIYAEAKRLSARGLVDTEHAPRGARERTIYRLTEAGREALRAWLATPSGGFAFHCESLLRAHLAFAGTREDLLAAVAQAQADAEALLRQAVLVGTEFLDGQHQFQAQVHIRALVFDFLWHFGLMMYLWAERTRLEVAGWDDLELGAHAPRALAVMREALEEGARVLPFLASQPGPPTTTTNSLAAVADPRPERGTDDDTPEGTRTTP